MKTLIFVPDGKQDNRLEQIISLIKNLTLHSVDGQDAVHNLNIVGKTVEIYKDTVIDPNSEYRMYVYL